MSEEKKTYYKERVTGASKQDQITLRRSFGKSPDELSMDATMTVYKLYPNIKNEYEAGRLAFITSMGCYYRDDISKGIPFSKACAKYYNDSVESAQRSMFSLIDSDYNNESIFYKKLSAFIKKLKSKGIIIDIDDMNQVLKYWDLNGKQRKVDIAKAITFSNITDEKNQEETE